MNCERFKTRMTDFALGADDAELRAHLDACPSCRAELGAQRALLASIDRGLASMVAAKPAGDFAAQVRRRIAQEGVSPRPWFSGWLPVTAAAALALVVFVAVLTIGRPPRPPQSVRVTQPAPIAPAGTSREAAPPEAARPEPPRTVAFGRRPPRELQSATNREPEVLVPRGQMDAVMQLYNSVWSGKADGTSLTAQAAPMSENLKPLTIAELKIPTLEIVPLESGEQPKGPSENR
jgi:hypothetical protein